MMGQATHQCLAIIHSSITRMRPRGELFWQLSDQAATATLWASKGTKNHPCKGVGIHLPAVEKSPLLLGLFSLYILFQFDRQVMKVWAVESLAREQVQERNGM